MGPNPDFEMILPYIIKNALPVGLVGLLLAGLFAAFMSNYAATINAAPAYVVNDIYKRFINPHAEDSVYVRLSIFTTIAFVLIGFGFGFLVTSINDITLWIVSALWGGYTASNVLKWYWWRLNGHGYLSALLCRLYHWKFDYRTRARCCVDAVLHAGAPMGLLETHFGQSQSILSGF